MITPILKDPKKHGGTLYTFPSASRDLTRAFSNSEYEFAFSHFACLNLPDFRYGKFEEGDSNNKGDLKGVYLNNLHPNSFESLNNLNESLKWHLQSYVMNFEVAILNGFSLDSNKYDIENLRTPSERIFFNWLQKVGAIRFNSSTRNADVEETLNGYGDDADVGYGVLYSESELSSKDKTKMYRIGNKLYAWKGGEWRSRILVSKTVQYIGIIDMINNVNIDYDSFNEIYLNIPAGVGGSTKIVFNNIFDDNNYQQGEIIDVDNDEFCTDANYIIGRNPEELGMTNDKTLAAIYDSTFDPDLGTGSDSDYYLGHYLEHYYKIENGYCINFNDSKYGGIDKMNMSSEEDFEFNCVLIYYKIRKGNGEWTTNLYGVLFLEEVSTSDYNINKNEDDERAGYIQRYPKFKNGNSWGLKLDLKIDAQPDSQMVLREKEYDDPNEGAGMQMFAEALVHLNDCTKIFYEVKNENTDIEKRLYELENIVSGVDTMYELRDNVVILRNKIELVQPTIDSLEGRMNNVESMLSTLNNNLGYLIRDYKDLEQGVLIFKENVNTTITTFKGEVGNQITTFKGEVNKDISSIKTEVSSRINAFTADVNNKMTSMANDISTFKKGVNNTIASFKEDVNEDISTFKEGVNTTITTMASDISTFKTQMEESIETMRLNIQAQIDQKAQINMDGDTLNKIIII